MRDLYASEIRRLRQHLARAERRIAVSMLPGKVKQKDPDKRQLRLQIGVSADGSPVYGPWSRWQEATAGQGRWHAEPDMDEQMVLWSQSGTVGAQSMAVPSTYDKDHDAPSKASDKAVFMWGAGGFEIGDFGVRFFGETLEHNGVYIGEDHVHTKVVPGGANSGPPPGS
ncbi:MAG: phage baseplate assembly protein V [Rhizobiaceae bacterium]